MKDHQPYFTSFALIRHPDPTSPFNARDDQVQLRRRARGDARAPQPCAAMRSSSGRVRRTVLRVPALAALAPGSGGAVACHALDLGRAVMCGCSVGAARMSELVAAAPGASASSSASASASASASSSATSSVSVSTLIAEGDSDADEADAVARALVLAFAPGAAGGLGSGGGAGAEGGGSGDGGKLVLLSWNVPAGLPPLAREAVRRAFIAWAAPGDAAARGGRDAEAWAAAEEAVRASAGSGGGAVAAC
jgi:hypothetical protein